MMLFFYLRICNHYKSKTIAKLLFLIKKTKKYRLNFILVLYWDKIYVVSYKDLFFENEIYREN